MSSLSLMSHVHSIKIADAINNYFCILDPVYMSTALCVFSLYVHSLYMNMYMYLYEVYMFLYRALTRPYCNLNLPFSSTATYMYVHRC